VPEVPEVDATLSALADPTRRRVIELLRKTPRRAGDLASSLAISPPALSRHLRMLRAAGLVQEESQEDDARVRVYSLKPEPFQRLRHWLDEVESFWGVQLGSFKAHAERTRKRDKP
jgi:DNA-binding transcriptional ArsR family regulator